MAINKSKTMTLFKITSNIIHLNTVDLNHIVEKLNNPVKETDL